jgi:hypothetical protein
MLLKMGQYIAAKENEFGKVEIAYLLCASKCFL